MEKIELPHSVSREDRAEIKKALTILVSEDDDSRIEYVQKNLKPVVVRLFSYDQAWLSHMAQIAVSFWFFLKKARLRKRIRLIVIAGLFYLVDPFDIIPDYVMGLGYLDDALVLNTCLGLLKKENVTIELLSQEVCEHRLNEIATIEK